MNDSNEFKHSLENATPFTEEELKQHENTHWFWVHTSYR